MNYVVQQAPDGMALDTAYAISPAKALQIAATPLNGQKVVGVAQYVGLHNGNGPGDITAANLQGIMAAGLGLWLIQHCFYADKWDASAALGTSLGQAALANAQSVGYLPGAALELDLEGCRTKDHGAVIDFCNAWADVVTTVYRAELYNGWEDVLTPGELYHALPKVHGYHRAFNGSPVAVRGHQIEQGLQVSYLGMPTDPNKLQADQLGDRLWWMQAA